MSLHTLSVMWNLGNTLAFLAIPTAILAIEWPGSWRKRILPPWPAVALVSSGFSLMFAVLWLKPF